MAKIAFVWQESSKPEVFNHWNDGLRKAMQLLEKEHTVTYHEPTDDITDVDVILYWEAPCTIRGRDQANYEKVRLNPIRKALLFAGGEVRKEWVEGFDHIFVESKINADEFSLMEVPHSTAFGINTDVFRPVPQAKVFDAELHSTFAGWKRPRLLAQALGPRALLVGKFQEHEKILYEESQAMGACVLPKAPYEMLPYLICSAHVCVNPCEFWGGGQRTTLEALACGLPVVVTTDSPKNREFIEESGCGEIVEPDPNRIREAVDRLKARWTPEDAQRAIDYVHSKWTYNHYYNALNQWLSQLLLSSPPTEPNT